MNESLELKDSTVLHKPALTAWRREDIHFFLDAGSPNWIVFAALVSLLVGFHHATPLDDLTSLSPGRYAVGVLCLVLLVLLIPPVPIQVFGQ